MIRGILTPIMLASSLSVSANTPDDFTYTLIGCDTVCEVIDIGVLNDLVRDTPGIEKSPKAGKGKASLVKHVSIATGMAKSAVGKTIGALRDSAVSAGFHHFKAELYGPAGSVSFDMNLKAATWNMRSSISGGFSDSMNKYIK